jgi:DNA polymerase I
MGSRLPFRHVVLADFEYRQVDGELPEVRCLCARDMCSGREWRLWADELGARPPFPTGADSLFVGYYLSAEFSAFHALGWPLPTHSLDLYVEFRVATNGRPTPWGKRSLLAALEHFEIDGIDAVEKQGMRGLAMRTGPSSSYAAAERRDLLDYCMTDVLALECLLRPILREVLFAAGDAPRRCFRQALMRGEYMAALAVVEARGAPIDVDMFDRLRRAWHQIPRRLAARLDPKFGVFVDGKVSRERLAEYLVREELCRSWPRTEARGWLDTSADTFKEMARLHPRLEPLHQAVATLAQAKNLALKVGADGRNRAFLSGFGAKTGRNTPSSTEYVFGLSAWMRHLIKPVPEHTLLYVDWHAQEPGIGGTLSQDGALIEAYDQGDVYLGFAKLSGLAPAWATKATHGDLRDAIKVTFLAVG